MKMSKQLNQPSWAVIIAIAIVAGLAILLLLPRRVQTDRFSTPAASNLSTLYDKLGGRDAIVALVDEFVSTLSADRRISPFFAKIDLVRFKQLFVEQLCETLGGPCKYSGRSMKETHAGLGIKHSDFANFIEDFVMAMDKLKLPEDQKNALISLLDRMKPDIVEKKESP